MRALCRYWSRSTRGIEDVIRTTLKARANPKTLAQLDGYKRPLVGSPSASGGLGWTGSAKWNHSKKSLRIWRISETGKKNQPRIFIIESPPRRLTPAEPHPSGSIFLEFHLQFPFTSGGETLPALCQALSSDFCTPSKKPSCNLCRSLRGSWRSGHCHSGLNHRSQTGSTVAISDELSDEERAIMVFVKRYFESAGMPNAF